MARKKRSTHQTISSETTDGESASPTITLTTEKDLVFVSLQKTLAEVNKIEGITGYILKNTTSAVIDLKDPSNLVAYALLSSHALDSSQEFSEMFALGTVDSILIEGEEGKVLFLTNGVNQASVFMERDVDHSEILKLISPLPPKDN
jgi:predicted regulator of Ras-like GTPase activity (Roadblock/LC7/MglB family)